MAETNGTEAHVQVAVRARPLNQREVKIYCCFKNLILLFNTRFLSI